MMDHLWRVFDHAAWANRRILPYLDTAPAAGAGWPAVFFHVLAAERIWSMRLHGEDASALEVWPTLSLEECATWTETNITRYRSYLAAMTNDALGESITYRKSSGEGYTNTRADVLTHVAMHGSYHRGQIAAAIRRSGAVPPVTDFIAYAREARRER